ncbi:unnamed protein product, partial [Toxocara canis]|uniref:Gamma-secretase subunit PEN-2 n=1 Tax=Toxocara canis TaxID=6265 RepID=A0A183VGP3_TOXCA
ILESKIYNIKSLQGETQLVYDEEFILKRNVIFSLVGACFWVVVITVWEVYFQIERAKGNEWTDRLSFMSTWGDTLQGLAACAVSSLFFGSMFVPLKTQDAGDGLFTQWVMGAAIFVIGMIVNAYEGFPTFHPLAMLGGALWATGSMHSRFLK